MFDFSNAVIKIENTTLCGASCVMCPRDKFRFSFGVMSFGCFRSIVDQTAALGIGSMIFGGLGDPLMDKYLKQRLEYVKINYPDVKMSMINTGHLLKGRNLDLICEYLDVIKISNYGFSKEAYESVHRGKLRYEKVRRNIDQFLERQKRPYTIMTFLDLVENHAEMEAWIRYYEPKCERVDVWKPHNWGGGSGTAAIGAITAPCKRALALSDLTFCADGSVSMCCFDYNRELTIGNILVDSLENVINGERVARIQQIFESSAVLGSDLICKNCDQIRNRSDALIYTSDKNMWVGKNSMQTFKK
jgi:MoaA/NifB/PqqE/SkfB family radical SAM enzyme